MPSPASSTIGAASTRHETAIPSSKGAAVAGEATRISPSPGGAIDAQRPVGRKRRRIPRACDDCRRKKIKCDGKRPCASCADFNSKCTYNGPSVRGAGNASATASATASTAAAAATAGRRPNDEVAALARRLRAAESIIRRCLPQLDLAKLEDAAKAQPAPAQQPPEGSAPSSRADDAAADGARFIRLVGSADQLDLTDSGEYQFHGISSGAAFLSRIDQHFPGLLRHDSRMPFLPQPSRPSPAKPLELPVYSANPWRLEDHDHEHLPPRDLACALCGYALSWGSCLLRVVHAPSFWTTFETLYSGGPQNQTNQQRRFVGLLFAVMALGSMYDVDENDPTNPDHYAVAIERGYKYYTSARHFLQDITECSDLVTLQAMVFLIQFLQATGNLNGCHTLIGIALRSALRMGLHRHLPHIPMSPIQDETRRRVFHSIRQMDIYLCTSLGLPIMLRDGDINQPRPTEVDDEYITENGIQRPPPGTSSFLEAFNAHLELMRILADVVDHLYPPPRGTDPGLANVTYVISCTRVREIEQALHDWHENLAETWRPGPEENAEITRVKILLRSAYAHVQLMLYRPFLQYYSRRASADETADARYFAFAAAGISVCRNIIYIGLEIRRQGVLIGPYWFITNTQFFAILTLVLYVLYNPDKPEASELFADAKLGKECISGLTQRSMAADRVTAALNSFFDQLPARFRWADAPSPDVVPPVGPSRIDYRTNHGSRPSTQPRTLSSAGPKILNRPAPAPAEKSRSAGDMAANQQTPVTPSGATISRPAQYHEALNWMALPQEDPFAYPIMPGVSLTNNDFSAFEDDGLRLPLYNLPPDMDGQLLQLQDPLHASLLPYMSTDPSETLYAAFAASGNPSNTLPRNAQDTLAPPWGFQS